jgi:hypothetical protein
VCAALINVSGMMRGARRHIPALRDPELHRRVCAARTAFAYVLPCRHEDILKVGFSCDPLARMQTLHPRYFEFFALDRVLLVGTETVGDARQVERELLRAAELHRAPAPLLVSAAAGGHTEWYRGAYPLLCAAATEQAVRGGYVLHAPAGPWLRQQLEKRGATLYETSGQLLRAIDDARAYGVVAGSLERQLRNLLDARAALELDLMQCVPPAVLAWYQSNITSAG